MAADFDDDLLPFFPARPELSSATGRVGEGRVDEKIQRWCSEPPVAAPCALKFWKQPDDQNNY